MELNIEKVQRALLWNSVSKQFQFFFQTVLPNPDYKTRITGWNLVLTCWTDIQQGRSDCSLVCFFFCQLGGSDQHFSVDLSVTSLHLLTLPLRYRLVTENIYRLVMKNNTYFCEIMNAQAVNGWEFILLYNISYKKVCIL